MILFGQMKLYNEILISKIFPYLKCLPFHLPVVLDGPLDSNFKPFNQPGQQGKALCFRPDIMEMDEERTFPEFKR